MWVYACKKLLSMSLPLSPSLSLCVKSYTIVLFKEQKNSPSLLGVQLTPKTFSTLVE